MRSVDTNVVVRYLVADDDAQFERVKRLFEDDEVLILTTVLLEVEWVLRSTYRLPTDAVTTALRHLARQDGVRVQDATLLFQALELAEQGLDLADALHLSGSVGCTDFVSFDRQLARRAAKLSVIRVSEP